MYLLGHRFYDPASGRFLSRDPAGMGNLYAYADGNPEDLSDPTDLYCFTTGPSAHPWLIVDNQVVNEGASVGAQAVLYRVSGGAFNLWPVRGLTTGRAKDIIGTVKPRFELRISKATVKAWAASFITLLGVGLIALVIVWSIPSTPFAQIHHFSEMNNNNPEVFNTGLYQEDAPVANLWDGVVITGIAFLLAGIPFGWITGRKGQSPAPVLRGAALCAFCLSALIVGVGWMGVVALSRANYLESGLTPPIIVPTADYWKTGAVQVAFWTAAFLCGTFLATKLPRRTASRPPNPAPSA